MAENQQTPTATVEPKAAIACPECGKECGSRAGWAMHRKGAHGVKPQGTPHRRGPVKVKRGVETTAPAARDMAGMVRRMFDGMAEEMEQQAKMATAIVDGYAAFVDRMKKLRLAYIKATTRLRQLQSKAALMADAANGEREFESADEEN